MSALVAQEAEERMALDVFRRASGLLAGLVTRVQPDPPDFLVTNGAQRVAVEMTRYHKQSGPKGSPLAEREALESRIVARSQAIFEASNPGVHLMVSFYFVHGSLSRRNLEEMSTRLAEAVASLIPPLSTAEPLTSKQADYRDPEFSKVADVITGVDVHRSRSVHRNLWDGGGAGILSTDVTELESLIRAKESDLSRYKTSFDQRWLIIYAIPQASALFDLAVLTPQMFRSTFDRAAFIDVLLGRYELVA